MKNSIKCLLNFVFGAEKTVSYDFSKKALRSKGFCKMEKKALTCELETRVPLEWLDRKKKNFIAEPKINLQSFTKL